MNYIALDDDTLKVSLPEKIDSRNTDELQKEIDGIINNNPGKNLQFDAVDVKYISSAGLRMFLKYQKHGNLDSIVRVSNEVFDIFAMTGMDKAINVVKSFAENSTSENEIIGEDSTGTLYRIDEDSVIYVYKSWVSVESITAGREYSQLAMGTPISNAICYEPVKTETGLALEYAVNHYDTVINRLTGGHEVAGKVIVELVRQLKVIHDVSVFEDKLRVITDELKALIDSRMSDFSIEEKNIIKSCVNMLSRSNCPILINADTRTLLYSEDTILFTDLSALRYGNPIFEMAAAYKNLIEHGMFMGASGDAANENFSRFISEYADTWNEEIIERYSKVCRAFGYLLSLLYSDPQLNAEVMANIKANIRTFFVSEEDHLKSLIAETKKHQTYGNMDTSQFLLINIHERTARKGFKKKLLLKDIALDIFPGEMVLLMGGSGAGKTTFLNAVTGYEKADAKITKGDVDIYRDYATIKHRLAFAPQQDLLRDDDTVYNTLKNAADMRLPVDTSKEERESKIQQMLDIFGLADLKNSSISSLSGGQRKRASIAVEFISDPILFFLDEPDSGLDGVMARSLMEDLRKITGNDKIIIVISHAPDRVIDLFDKIIVLAKSEVDGAGHLAFYGTPKEAREFFERDTMEQVLKIVNRRSEGGEGRTQEFIDKYNSWK